VLSTIAAFDSAAQYAATMDALASSSSLRDALEVWFDLVLRLQQKVLLKTQQLKGPLKGIIAAPQANRLIQVYCQSSAFCIKGITFAALLSGGEVGLEQDWRH
jgi:hypothetical protein